MNEQQSESDDSHGDDEGADSEPSEMDSHRLAQLSAMFGEPEPEINLERQAFNRESFKRLINKTYEDYYPLEFNREHFVLDEYMALVSAE